MNSAPDIELTILNWFVSIAILHFSIAVYSPSLVYLVHIGQVTLCFVRDAPVHKID